MSNAREHILTQGDDEVFLHEEAEDLPLLGRRGHADGGQLRVLLVDGLPGPEEEVVLEGDSRPYGICKWTNTIPSSLLRTDRDWLRGT